MTRVFRNRLAPVPKSGRAILRTVTRPSPRTSPGALGQRVTGVQRDGGARAFVQVAEEPLPFGWGRRASQGVAWSEVGLGTMVPFALDVSPRSRARWAARCNPDVMPIGAWTLPRALLVSCALTKGGGGQFSRNRKTWPLCHCWRTSRSLISCRNRKGQRRAQTVTLSASCSCSWTVPSACASSRRRNRHSQHGRLGSAWSVAGRRWA